VAPAALFLEKCGQNMDLCVAIVAVIEGIGDFAFNSNDELA
jgi:hypothetical protein